MASKRRRFSPSKKSLILNYIQHTITLHTIWLCIKRNLLLRFRLYRTFILISVMLEIYLKICGNKMPTRCNRGFYCRSYCLLSKFRAPLCPSSGAQEYYTVVAACGISCCKDVKSNFVS